MKWEKKFHVNHSVWVLGRWGGGEVGRGVLNKVLYVGGSTLRSNPFPINIPFLTEEVPLSFTFCSQMVAASLTLFRSVCIPFNCYKCTVF